MLLTDPVFIIVNHDEAINAARQDGSEDSDIYRSAVDHVNENQAII